jgi:2-iminoacetate synthase
LSFYESYRELKDIQFEEILGRVTEYEVFQILKKDRLDEQDFMSLLAPSAGHCLEPLAQKSHQLTVQHFGHTMVLFAPIYVSDFCVNSCTYCSFSIENTFQRKKLTLDEVESEGAALAASGIKHIILLTGESPQQAGHGYLKDCIRKLIKHTASITLEVQPMDRHQYAEMVDCGADGLTIYQEVYNEEVYSEIHRKGPKRDYLYRLDAPERACQAGMRSVTVGPLLGLDNWRKEVFFAGMHAYYLQDRYPEADIGVSLPRIRPHIGGWEPLSSITDKEWVQAMLALRLFLPRSGITLSTRESEKFRNHLIKLGVTKMSAASSTAVGGYSNEDAGTPQFETSDERSVEEICSYLRSQGYQPVMVDWPMFEYDKAVD